VGARERRGPPGRPLVGLSVAAVLLAGAAAATSLATPGPAQGYGGAADPLVLYGEVSPETRWLAELVVGAAARHRIPIVATELEIRFVDRIEPDGFLGGRTDGRLILVGRNVARPERTLLHELAHAAVGLQHGHDEPWRRVYLTAFAWAQGERAAERELRRLRWVYDKSYLDPRAAGS
jgi:hypothetical protein